MTALPKYRWLRRMLWSATIIVVAILALWKVPLFRHHPSCLGYPAEGQKLAPGVVPSFWGLDNEYAVEGRLSDHYSKIFTSALESYGISFFKIDGIVLLRLWDRIADPTGLIFNADQKTYHYLADPAKGHPIWNEMPEDVRERLLQLRQGADEREFCEYVRPIVLRNWGRD